MNSKDVQRELHSPIFAGVGTGFVIAELTSREALARAVPDLAAFREAARRFPEIGNRFQVHLYFRDGADPGRLATRAFVSLFGIL